MIPFLTRQVFREKSWWTGLGRLRLGGDSGYCIPGGGAGLVCGYPNKGKAQMRLAVLSRGGRSAFVTKLAAFSPTPPIAEPGGEWQ